MELNTKNNTPANAAITGGSEAYNITGVETAQRNNLIAWFVREPEFTAKLAARYADILLAQGVPSISKLRKRLCSKTKWLTDLGVDPTDAAEILAACTEQAGQQQKEQASVTKTSEELSIHEQLIMPTLSDESGSTVLIYLIIYYTLYAILLTQTSSQRLSIVML